MLTKRTVTSHYRAVYRIHRNGNAVEVFRHVYVPCKADPENKMSVGVGFPISTAINGSVSSKQYRYGTFFRQHLFTSSPMGEDELESLLANTIHVWPSPERVRPLEALQDNFEATLGDLVEFFKRETARRSWRFYRRSVRPLLTEIVDFLLQFIRFWDDDS